MLLSIKLGKLLFASDDGKAVKAAKFFNVPFIITPKIVLDLFNLNNITFQKARKSIEKLAKIGRYSPEIIADALVSLLEENNDQTNHHKDTRKIIENAQRAHAPLLAAGLASELKNYQISLHLGDSLQLAAGIFNLRTQPVAAKRRSRLLMRGPVQFLSR